MLTERAKSLPITTVNTDTKPEAINLLSPLRTRATGNNQEATLIEQVDAEPLSTVGQLRSYLCNRLNEHHFHLKHKHKLLDKDNNTLASYGWASGECRRITVHADDQPDITLYCLNIRLQ